MSSERLSIKIPYTNIPLIDPKAVASSFLKVLATEYLVPKLKEQRVFGQLDEKYLNLLCNAAIDLSLYSFSPQGALVSQISNAAVFLVNYFNIHIENIPVINKVSFFFKENRVHAWLQTVMNGYLEGEAGYNNCVAENMIGVKLAEFVLKQLNSLAVESSHEVNQVVNNK